MPVLEMRPSVAGRFRIFVRAQLPLLAGLVFVLAEATIAVPDAFEDTDLMVGSALIGAASIAALVVPWERWNVHWLLSVAILDVLGVAWVRLGLVDAIAAVGLLSVFPVMWMVYGFRRETVALAIASVLFIALFPFIQRGALPQTALEWANALTLPVLMVGIVVAVRVVARQVRRSQDELQLKAVELKESLRAAEDAESILRSVLDTVDMAVAYFDADNRLVLANRVAHSVAESAGFALDAEPYAGARVWGADRRTPIPPERQTIPRALAGQIVDGHLEWVGPPDDQRAILATAQRVLRPTGESLGTVVAAYDVTRLVEAINVRDNFLLTVSHELRTPLTSIMGYLDLLHDQVGPENVDAMRMISVIDRNARSLLQRITELLAFAPDGITLLPERVDVVELVEGVVASSRPRADAGSITLEHLSEGPVYGMFDTRRTVQLVENLVTNAIKYTPPGGRVEVCVVAHPEEVGITVSDTGIGMSAQEQRHVFDRFYRAQAARAHAIQGLGVGLALVKEIVTAYGGTVTIRSGTAQGTTVTVHLPRDEVLALRAEPLGAAARRRGTSSTA